MPLYWACPIGVAPQRYLFSSGKYQYSLMLESGSDRQTLALRFAPGLYDVQTDDIFHRQRAVAL